MHQDGAAHLSQVSFQNLLHPAQLTEGCSWTLEGPTYPRMQRKTLSLKTINKAPLKHAHDDEVSAPSSKEVASIPNDHRSVH
jgi:hypothetical protein